MFRLFLLAFLVGFGGKLLAYDLFTENGKVGLKDSEGHIVIPAQFDALGWSDGSLTLLDNRITGYALGHQWGLLSIDNKRITRATYHVLLPTDSHVLIAGAVSDVSFRTSYGTIDLFGKTIIPFIYDGLRISSGRAITITRQGDGYRFGLITLDNKVLLPANFLNIYSIGSLRYAVVNTEGKTGLYNENGTRVSDFLIDSIAAFNDGSAIIYVDSRQGLINRDGLVSVPPLYREVAITDEGAVRVRLPDKWDLLDPENKLLGTLEADAVQPIGAHLLRVDRAGDLTLLRTTLEPGSSHHFDYIGEFSNHLAIAGDEGRLGVLLDNGQYLLSPRFAEVNLNGKFIRARTPGQSGGWEVYDTEGVRITKKNYSDIQSLYAGAFAVKDKTHWGLISQGGDELVACVYDSILEYNDEQAVVKFYGGYGIITMQDQWRLTPRPNRLRLLTDEYYAEVSDSTWYLKSFSGKLIYFSTNRFQPHGDHLDEFVSGGGIWEVAFDGTISHRILPPSVTYQSIFPASDGLRMIIKDGKYGFVDDEGLLRIANRYDEARDFENGFAPIKLRHHWGFIDKSDQIAVQPNFDDVYPFRMHASVVEKDGKFGLVNDTDEIILPIRYDSISAWPDGRYLVVTDQLCGVADHRGTLLLQPRYDEVIALRNHALVKMGNKYGVVTMEGVNTVPPIYDRLVAVENGAYVLGQQSTAWKDLAP